MGSVTWGKSLAPSKLWTLSPKNEDSGLDDIYCSYQSQHSRLSRAQGECDFEKWHFSHHGIAAVLLVCLSIACLGIGVAKYVPTLSKNQQSIKLNEKT